MKKILSNCAFLLGLLLLVACQEDEFTSNTNVGYLRLQLGVTESTNTKAEVYNPKQMHVQILNAQSQVVEETTNFATEWEGKSITLPVGTYTLRASSAGFDGQTSGFNKPYYAGSTEITIEKNTEINANVTCTLANVKVTVNFDDSFKNYFNWATVDVDNYEEGNDGTSTDAISPQTFVMGLEKGSAYFPVTDLQATVNVANKRGEQHSQTNTIKGVKARDHYILNYSVSGGNGGVEIAVDESTRTYTFNVYVPSEPTTQLTKPTVNAWSKLAYLESNAIPSETSEDELLPANMKMQYRKTGENTWLNAETITTTNDTTYRATITNLEPNTAYQCRMVYGEEEFISEVTDFTTEAATELQNGGFEDWCTIQIKGLFSNVNTAYPNASADIKFWDTSNTGANTMSTNDPTNKITDPVVSGNYAAKLESKKVVIAFAAASLYTGTFGSVQMSSMSATLNFGQPFNSRPIALHGYYKYTPANVDNVGKNLPADATVSEGKPDECSIYIAMSKKSYEIDNSDPSTFIDFEGDDNIIAYGALPSGAATQGEGYTEFNIPLKYKNLTEQPTHIIIVCSASKYGDYMTGGAGSTLYVDDFSLVYDGEPTLWE